jgi:glycerophosphoryl diester phosphodiesterase
MAPSTTAILARSWDTTLVVGHRGAAAYRPENTIAAFEEGIACKAEAVECDVHLSSDREMVIMHDATLDRTTTLKGKIKETPWATMKAAGIPSLADLTKVTKDRSVLVVEIKDGEGVEPMVVDHLRKEKLVDQSIVFSFHSDRIAKVEALAPEFTSVWLVGAKVDPANLESTFEKLRACKADGIGVDYHNCPAELAAEARKRKIPLFVWTVPPGEHVDRLKALRVNFIITNHPRDVRKQLGLDEESR